MQEQCNAMEMSTWMRATSFRAACLFSGVAVRGIGSFVEAERECIRGMDAQFTDLASAAYCAAGASVLSSCRRPRPPVLRGA
jgi:hypothetical protein